MFIQKAEKEEQERKAREEAEKQRLELEERLRKEEEERAERKRVRFYYRSFIFYFKRLANFILKVKYKKSFQTFACLYLE